MFTSRIVVLALGALGLITACEADVEDPDYLGANPTTGSAVPPPPLAPVQEVNCATETPSLVRLPASLCPATTTVASGVTAALAASDGGYLVSVGTGVESRERLADGCPGPGEIVAGIEVAAGETLPGALAQGDERWVAHLDRVDVHDSLGTRLASCALAGARALAASGPAAWAAVGGGIVPLRYQGTTCEVGAAWGLEGGVAQALGASGGGDDEVWVATARVGCGTPVTVERRNSAGPVKDARSYTAAALGLCTVSAVVEYGGALWLGDRVCGRVVEMSTSTGQPAGSWQAPAGQTVLGVATRTPGALVLTGASGGGERQFQFLTSLSKT